MDAKLIIDPPLLNSSSPWATTLADLKALYHCPSTGAITTRTSLINGFNDNPDRHQHCFFDAGTAGTKSSATSVGGSNDTTLTNHGNSSLNTYGYSPIPLHEYISYIKQVVTDEQELNDINNNSTTTTRKHTKLIIVSVTGTPADIVTAYQSLSELRRDHGSFLRLAMEINLSCPNIAGKPPPAYNETSLSEYLHAVQDVTKPTVTSSSLSSSSAATAAASSHEKYVDEGQIPVGIKLPPYTYQGQFDMLVECLRKVIVAHSSSSSNTNRSVPTTKASETTSPTTSTSTSTTANGINGNTTQQGNESENQPHTVISFVTSTNTLGTSLVLDHHTNAPVLQSESATGIGGMAGSAIHSLSLGNISTLNRLLKQYAETRGVRIIGVGGVSDHAGYMRMRSVGADAVGVATALGREGVDVFERILMIGD